MKQRHEIINEALRIRAEITQIFNDCEHWNNGVRKPSVVPINADPDGQMERYRNSIEAGLRKELLCVHVQGPDDIEACASLEDGDKRADELNAYFDSLPKTEKPPELHARVQAWPYDAEDHAKDLSKPK
jgi:hypothetical protein